MSWLATFAPAAEEIRFTIAAMAVPMLSEFNVAIGASIPQEDEDVERRPKHKPIKEAMAA
jgi:hypothetical protein